MTELLHDLAWVLPLRGELMTALMHGFSWLGYDKFILLFLPLGYWAWSKPVFLRLFILVSITALLNAFLKDLWQDPRPDLAFRLDQQVGESFGAPSGHSQIAVVLWLWLAYEMRRTWGWALAGFITLGVIFSRLYLGAHDLEDVLAGSALGAATLVVFALVKDWPVWRSQNVLWHMALVILVVAPALLCWPGVAPYYVPMLSGMLLGVLAGYWLETRQLDFYTQTQLWRRVLAAVIGCVAFLLLQIGLKKLGAQLAWPDMLWQSLRGVLMGLFIAVLVPWLLVQMRLLPARRRAPSA